MDLKTLAKKAASGFVAGNLTKNGMGLTNAENLTLNRMRRKESPEMQKKNLFSYICYLIANEYGDDAKNIINSGAKAEMNGKQIYPELSKIDPNIALCLVMFELNVAHSLNMMIQIPSFNVYNETMKLYRELNKV